MKPRALPAGIVALALAGCASYAPQPLPGRVSLAADARSVTVDAARLPFRSLATHVFDPADGLDMDEVAMLAVANNPQLRQARDDLGIARAQAFAAGLLPDPQLGASFDHPTNGAAGNTSAFNLNPTFDASALLLRSSRRGAAEAAAQRVSLDLLWQEWQVVSQARLLYTRIMAEEAVRKELESERALLAERYRASRAALAAGNVTIDFAATLLAAVQKIEKQVNDLERSRLQDRARLNALLGIVPETPLALAGEPQARALDPAAVRAGLEGRLALRPDLQALRAGYRSQEEKFRGAVLAQFPALNVGLTRARDTSGLYTLGFGLTLSLPVFNRNRGNIAIEKATRKRLFDEYQNRLDSAYGEIAVALENQPLLERQLASVRSALAELREVAERADAAYRTGNFAAADYTRLRIALIDKQTEEINLEEALTEQRIALETLLGPGLPEAPGGGER
ncbi:MAG TPA: TolC family protein [Burkholderiales bacterium]|nr:TolC family protein [Burkholderiales bacterium]